MIQTDIFMPLIERTRGQQWARGKIRSCPTCMIADTEIRYTYSPAPRKIWTLVAFQVRDQYYSDARVFESTTLAVSHAEGLLHPKTRAALEYMRVRMMLENGEGYNYTYRLCRYRDRKYIAEHAKRIAPVFWSTSDETKWDVPDGLL